MGSVLTLVGAQLHKDMSNTGAVRRGSASAGDERCNLPEVRRCLTEHAHVLLPRWLGTS